MKSNIEERAPSLTEIARGSRLRERHTMGMLRQLVELESPSHDMGAVNRVMDLASSLCRELGGRVVRHRQRKFGDLVEARFGAQGAKSNRGRPPILLLGHLDTVWPLGTLRRMPYHVKDGRIWGPGTLDMKAGVAMALTALGILREAGAQRRPLILLLNSDEEIGSPVSRPVTERIAQGCEAVFVLEPGQGLNGAYKTARKGTGDFMVRVTGVAAHAGVDFEVGHSAVIELARQIEKIRGFTDMGRGLTVNPGVIGGGTQANVVAAEAWVHCDFRFGKAIDAKKVEQKFRALRPMDRKCMLEVTGGVNRPPMERTVKTARLFRLAATLAEELGFALQEAATGGGSDGNFTSALGVPTLDGMGAVGEGAHATHESVLLEHLAPRTALLAAMMMKV
jgi:glutamate carboxypeptidase